MTPQGWSDEVFLRVMNRWGNHRSSQLCWPNYEAGHANGSTVWGSYLWPEASPHLSWGDVPGSAAGLGVPGLTPVADAWRAGNRYAVHAGNAAGFLTYEASHNPAGPIFGLIQVKPSAGLVFTNISRSDLGNPPFSDPGSVIQAVDRWAHNMGYLAGTPNFEQGLNSQGQVVYGAYLFRPDGPAGISHHDVPEAELLALGPDPGPTPPQPLGLAVTLTRTSHNSVQFVGTVPASWPGADRPIAWYSVSPPSTWSVDRLDVTRGTVTVASVPKNTFRHDFDGLLPVATWSVTFTGTNIIDDSLSMSIGLAP